MSHPTGQTRVPATRWQRSQRVCAVVVIGLLLLMVAGSLYDWSWRTGLNLEFGLSRGRFEVETNDGRNRRVTANEARFHVRRPESLPAAEDLMPDAHSYAWGWFVRIPLWMPIGAMALIWGGLARSARRRPAAGVCPVCGYELHGLAVDSRGRVVCPECGSAD